MSVALVILIVLMLGVIFVNGWTDAPNAIATAVSTRVISPRRAVIMAVILNFLGALVMSFFFPKVAETVSTMVVFTKDQNQSALVVLAAAMFAIVLWAVVAWYFGIPTSESHALMAGVSGGAIALGNFKAINMDAWFLVIVGLLISSALGFVSGFISTKGVELIFKRVKRATTNKIFNGGQAFAAGAMAFLHGAQDGQKFMGVFLLGIWLYNPEWVQKTADGKFDLTKSVWLIVLCSIVMGIGTSVGGYKIIKKVGMEMVKLEKYQGFAADFAASFCLLLASVTGVPVSTTHTKTTAIMGVGAAKRISAVNWGVAKEMVVAWVLTFPGCGLLAFLMAKLFLFIF